MAIVINVLYKQIRLYSLLQISKVFYCVVHNVRFEPCLRLFIYYGNV